MKKCNKAILIITVVILLFTICISIFNTDWYINKTLSIKNGNSVQLSKKIKYNYTSKYENDKLKIRMEFLGIEKDVFDLIYIIQNDNEYLVKLKFLDKDGFKVAEKEIYKNAFTYSVNSKGSYIVYASLYMDKRDVRKIKKIEIDYIKHLTNSYDEILKDIMKQMYLQLLE